MAEEPDNAVLRMLRDMRVRLDALDEIKASLLRLETRMDELTETATYAIGLAASNQLRVQGLSSQLDERKRRVTELEHSR
jgi:hypothetical protein